MKLFEEYVEEKKLSIRDKFGDMMIDKKTFIDDMFGDHKKAKLLMNVAYGYDTADSILDSFMYFIQENVYSDTVLKKMLSDFYDFTKNLSGKWEENDKVIGAGVDGIVFDLGDSVMKMFYKSFSDNTLKLVKALKEKNYKTLPKILRYDTRNMSWYVMEHLDITEEADDIAYEMFEEVDEFGNYYGDDKNFQAWYETFIDEAKDAGFDEILNCNLPDGVKNFDSHKGNFGERKNGDIVFFDPYCEYRINYQQ